MKGDFFLGDWLVQPSLGRLSLDGRTVQVRPKVMDLLVYLASSPGSVISKETLLNEVWHTEAISESALTRTITELRQAVADDVDQPRFLETIPKRGYRLIATVRPVVTSEERSSRRRRVPVPGIWLAALLVAGAIALLILARAPANPTETVQVRPLTSSPGHESQPCFSPDGKQVAFVWDGATDDNYDIYVKRIGEESVVRLTTDPAPDQSPAWSADGRAIAFVRGTDRLQLYVVSAAGGGERPVGDLVRTWTLRTAPPRSRILDWFPDGQALAVADQNSPGDPYNIIRISVDTGARHQLTSAPPQTFGDTQPDVSPDGREVAFTRSVSPNASDIHVVSAAGGEPHRLTVDLSAIVGLAWSEDGRSIVYSSERAAGMAGAGSLWRVQADASTSRREPELLAGIGPRAIVPAIASRGRLLAYQEYLADTNLWRASTTGLNSLEPVISSTREDTLPDYSSPDGARIAFSSNRSGKWEIWVANADGSTARQLTFYAKAPAWSPRWSPSGRLLAFGHVEEGNGDIYTMTPEGSSIRQLTVEPSEEETPSWSRDGHWLYFSSNRSGRFEIWKLAIDQPSQVVQVTRGGGTNPLESPDGKQLFYKKGERTALEIWTTPVSGGESTRVLGPIEGALAGAWVPDASGIYFIEPAWRIVYHQFSTGRATTIVTLGKDAMVVNPGLTLSPDGRWLLFAQRDRSTSDIMLVENFH
jgi:Tol biopolymer transport system component/DNA-binding winged helix-turn-helix (wHTH) protein